MLMCHGQGMDRFKEPPASLHSTRPILWHPRWHSCNPLKPYRDATHHTYFAYCIVHVRGRGAQHDS